MQLLNLPITVAVGPLVTNNFQLRGGPGGVGNLTMLLQGNFTYGSGGTTADAWVQTSLDGGATWTDVANFHFLLASARKALNLSSLTVVASFAPSDGTLAADTVKDGILGSLWRCKFTTTGTYAGGTVMRVDAIANGLAVLP
jgi:hypothetical protein